MIMKFSMIDIDLINSSNYMILKVSFWSKSKKHFRFKIFNMKAIFENSLLFCALKYFYITPRQNLTMWRIIATFETSYAGRWKFRPYSVKWFIFIFMQISLVTKRSHKIFVSIWSSKNLNYHGLKDTLKRD